MITVAQPAQHYYYTQKVKRTRMNDIHLRVPESWQPWVIGFGESGAAFRTTASISSSWASMIIKSQTNLWSSLRSALSSQVLHEIGLIRVSSSCRMRSSSNPLQVIAECHLRSACHSAPTPSDHQSLQPPSFPFCVYFYRVEFMGLGPFFIPPFQFMRWILIQTAHVPELLDDGKYCRKILPSEESARTLQATDGRHIICHKANVQLVSK